MKWHTSVRKLIKLVSCSFSTSYKLLQIVFCLGSIAAECVVHTRRFFVCNAEVLERTRIRSPGARRSDHDENNAEKMKATRRHFYLPRVEFDLFSSREDACIVYETTMASWCVVHAGVHAYIYVESSWGSDVVNEPGRLSLQKLSQGVVPAVKATVLIWSTRIWLDQYLLPWSQVDDCGLHVMHDDKTLFADCWFCDWWRKSSLLGLTVRCGIVVRMFYRMDRIDTNNNFF